jgi:hypothetical protein
MRDQLHLILGGKLSHLMVTGLLLGAISALAGALSGRGMVKSRSQAARLVAEKVIGRPKVC